jgi:RNA polymerase sigma-70 factor (ECF subfamily)
MRERTASCVRGRTAQCAGRVVERRISRWASSNAGKRRTVERRGRGVVTAGSVNLDLALAKRMLRGDEQALREFFDRAFPRLYRFALSRLAGDHDAASEVVQQSFCKAMERLDSYRGEAALYTWLCQICRNTLIDFCRKSCRAERLVRPIEEEPHIRAVLEAIAAPPEAQPEVQAWRSDLRKLVQATIDALPEHYGDVLEWKYVDGLAVADIALRLDIGDKAAESLLTRARGAFREAILAVADSPAAGRARGHDWSF